MLESYEADQCSFVVKIWVEERTDSGEDVLWRGHITHVPSNKRQYFQELDMMTAFVTAYLKELGIDAGKRA